ncbi:hypothetical protein MUK42_34931 [Musa troglodytarum]|uniref:Uncharacterized protein n=1 Tax=Musa troglodytarum TaxID=320322 RepID=A0A9E7JCS7_9LILI|nr:hypothetical protein MUK42_34931 [Musa troglodytarum]
MAPHHCRESASSMEKPHAVLVIPPAIFSAVGCDVALTLLISTGGGRKKEVEISRMMYFQLEISRMMYFQRAAIQEEVSRKKVTLSSQNRKSRRRYTQLAPRKKKTSGGDSIDNMSSSRVRQWRARTLLTGRRKWNPSPARLALHRLKRLGGNNRKELNFSERKKKKTRCLRSWEGESSSSCRHEHCF